MEIRSSLAEQTFGCTGTRAAGCQRSHAAGGSSDFGFPKHKVIGELGKTEEIMSVAFQAIAMSISPSLTNPFSSCQGILGPNKRLKRTEMKEKQAAACRNP